MKDGPPLRSPKKEEAVEVPEATFTQFPNSNESFYDDAMDELEGILGIEDDEYISKDNHDYGVLSWDRMDWEDEEEEDEDGTLFYSNKLEEGTRTSSLFEEDMSDRHCYGSSKVMKEESVEFVENGGDDNDDDRKSSLNLNLNYQEVLDAWSDRGPLFANDCSLSMASNLGYYMGEVPVMEEERARREASVTRYKEKRQTRLFSKKIRYQVRKLNADKRPRLKGRFVKRGS